MAGLRNPDGTALAAIVGGCAAAAAAMLLPLVTLGDSERIALAAAAGIGAALVVVAGLVIRRWFAARPEQQEADDVLETPPLRRQDLHPDAPPRRPIFAAADLGLPDPEDEPIPQLLERFERGLARRTARARPDSEGSGQEPPPADVDEALRDALGTLRQMASRVQ